MCKIIVVANQQEVLQSAQNQPETENVGRPFRP